eukprot:564252-Pyramimonas_sp.AAC.1
MDRTELIWHVNWQSQLNLPPCSRHLPRHQYPLKRSQTRLADSPAKRGTIASMYLTRKCCPAIVGRRRRWGLSPGRDL